VSLVLLALVGFVQVFALGFQSRNVNAGHYGWAAGTSFFIGLSQAVTWRFVTADQAGAIEALVYGVSGSLAIVAAMWVHRRFVGRGRA
jgi:hypothetical protein